MSTPPLVDITGGEPTYRTTTGGQPAVAPEKAAAQASGSGTQEVTWAPEDGNWTVVVMKPRCLPSSRRAR